jgi:sulfur-carrier protein
VSQVTVRYWAAARHAAGVAEEVVEAATLGELEARLAARADVGRICAASSYLVDGEQAAAETPLAPGALVDVLPPFAGG